MDSKRQCIGDGVLANQTSSENALYQSNTETRLYQSSTSFDLSTKSTPPASETEGIAYSCKITINPRENWGYFPETDSVDYSEDDRRLTYLPVTLPAKHVDKIAGTQAIRRNDTSAAGATYCFGMLIASLALFPQPKNVSNLLFRINSRVMLQLRFRVDGVSVLLPTTNDELGVLDIKTANALTKVMKIDPSITFEPYFYWKDVQNFKHQPSKFFSISVNVYGNAMELENVSLTLSNACSYLQEPPFFNKEFTYCNPHILNWTSKNTPMFLENQDNIKSEISNGIDVILNESAPVTVPKTLIQSSSISTTLRSHQLAGLHFMLTQELGSSSSEEDSMWTPEYHGLRVLFKHKITQLRQARVTLKCRGGILADEMGMGKSLTLLSLIAHTLEEARSFGANQHSCSSMERETKFATRATLLIAPKSVLYGWQTQVKEHTFPDSIKIHLYHGSKRTETLKQLANADIVLTTFETVSSDFSSSETLRNIAWFRIVLDEAHCIRNRATKTFHAIEDLVAERRWCLTGTPVQNKLEDLFSLTQFLRFHPLENHANARKYILEPLGRQDKTAITNLRLAIQTIALRRTKTTSRLKRREEVVIEVELTPNERQHYFSVRDKVRSLISSSKASQSHALLLCILYLRQLCSHGKPSISPSTSHEKNQNPDSGPLLCHKCGDYISANLKSARKEPRNCGHEICTDCRLEEKSVNEEDSNFALPIQCCVCQEPIISQSTKRKEPHDFSLESLLGDKNFNIMNTNLDTGFSSKIQHVFEKLIELDSLTNIETGEPIKSLVFSHWGRTLDCLEIVLRGNNLQFLRIDGSLTLEKRGTILTQFRKDPDVKILLLTYASGSTGLNLAMASRAHLLEPHWNPMVEAQAAARIDRLDQDKDIIIYRYIVKQSIEELIQQRQRHKVILAELSLSKPPSDDQVVDSKRAKGLESLLD